jgi:outer membrane protein, multidrug efflux system
MHNYKYSRVLALLILATVIGFVSCRSYKDLPEAGKVNVEGIIRDSVTNKTDTTTIADIPWKDYFTDSKLQVLINEGLQKNLDMQIALTRITEAEGSLDMSAASKLPVVSAGLQNTTTITSSGGDNVLGKRTNVLQLGLSASWEIDLWGKLNSQSKIKYASLLSSYEYKNLLQTQLVANIAKAYYTLLAYDEELSITKETIETLQKSYETMQQLMESGQQNAAAVEQSKALLYSTKLSAVNLESSIRQQENVISILLGRPLGNVDRSSIDNQIVNEHLAYGVPMQLLSRRPDVKQAELSFRSYCASTDVAKANFYPSLTISTASLGFASGDFSSLLKPGSIAAEIIAGITQPIFNQHKLKGNLKVAQAQQQESLLTFQSTLLSAGQEVSDILFGYQNSLNKNPLRKEQITSLTNAVDFTHDLLLSGEANYYEVLSAQQSLLSAQLSQVTDKLEQLTYGVNLYKALGGGTK